MPGTRQPAPRDLGGHRPRGRAGKPLPRPRPTPRDPGFPSVPGVPGRADVTGAAAAVFASTPRAPSRPPAPTSGSPSGCRSPTARNPVLGRAAEAHAERGRSQRPGADRASGGQPLRRGRAARVRARRGWAHGRRPGSGPARMEETPSADLGRPLPAAWEGARARGQRGGGARPSPRPGPRRRGPVLHAGRRPRPRWRKLRRRRGTPSRPTASPR